VASLAVATLLAYGAELHWLLERLCHLRVQLLWAGLALLPAVLLAGPRRWRWAVVLVLAALLNGREVTRQLPPGPPPIEQPTSPALRIFYANLLGSNPSAARLLPQLADADADLLVLLELTPSWEDRLADALEGYPHRVVESREDNFGLGLYSRLPLADGVIYDSPVAGFPLDVPLVETSVAAPWGPVRVLAAHPVPPTSALARRARDLQLRELAATVRAEPTPTVLVADLNTTVFAPAYREFIATSGLRNGLHAGTAPWRRGTWPAGLPAPLRISLDHALVGPGLQVARQRLGSIFGSDHLPLIVDVEPVALGAFPDGQDRGMIGPP